MFQSEWFVPVRRDKAGEFALVNEASISKDGADLNVEETRNTEGDEYVTENPVVRVARLLVEEVVETANGNGSDADKTIFFFARDYGYCSPDDSTYPEEEKTALKQRLNEMDDPAALVARIIRTVFLHPSQEFLDFSMVRDFCTWVTDDLGIVL